MAARFPAAEGDGQGGGLKIPAGTAPDAPFVTVLDPATGTATFLVEVIDVIHKHLQAKWAEGGLAAVPAIVNGQSAMVNFNDYWNLYVPQHLLPRLFGYELLMAPYAIAHMKIANKLTESGFHQFDRLGEGNRVRIYLTNALEPASDAGQLNLEGVLPALANEAKSVNEIKQNKRFTVIIGNPPYSASISEPIWLMRLLDDWKQGLKETKSDLNREEWKFLRLGEYHIAAAGAGLLGLIINRDFLDGIVKRRMREHLG